MAEPRTVRAMVVTVLHTQNSASVAQTAVDLTSAEYLALVERCKGLSGALRVSVLLLDEKEPA